MNLDALITEAIAAGRLHVCTNGLLRPGRTCTCEDVVSGNFTYEEIEARRAAREMEEE